VATSKVQGNEAGHGHGRFGVAKKQMDGGSGRSVSLRGDLRG